MTTEAHNWDRWIARWETEGGAIPQEAHARGRRAVECPALEPGGRTVHVHGMTKGACGIIVIREPKGGTPPAGGFGQHSGRGDGLESPATPADAPPQNFNTPMHDRPGVH